jgi:hypothetical protein
LRNGFQPIRTAHTHTAAGHLKLLHAAQTSMAGVTLSTLASLGARRQCVPSSAPSAEERPEARAARRALLLVSQGSDLAIRPRRSALGWPVIESRAGNDASSPEHARGSCPILLSSPGRVYTPRYILSCCNDLLVPNTRAARARTGRRLQPAGMEVHLRCYLEGMCMSILAPVPGTRCRWRVGRLLAGT